MPAHHSARTWAVPRCYRSLTTVTGESRRMVIGSPACSVATLRSPAATTPAPAPAPAMPPMAAPFPPPMMAPRMVPATAAAAHLLGGVVARRRAFANHRVGRNRQPRAVGQNDRLEPDGDSPALLELAAVLDLRHRAQRARAGRNRHAVADLHVAGDARFHAVLDPRAIARDGRLALQPDDGIRRDDELVVAAPGSSVAPRAAPTAPARIARPFRAGAPAAARGLGRGTAAGACAGAALPGQLRSAGAGDSLRRCRDLRGPLLTLGRGRGRGRLYGRLRRRRHRRHDGFGFLDGRGRRTPAEAESAEGAAIAAGAGEVGFWRSARKPPAPAAVTHAARPA